MLQISQASLTRAFVIAGSHCSERGVTVLTRQRDRLGELILGTSGDLGGSLTAVAKKGEKKTHCNSQKITPDVKKVKLTLLMRYGGLETTL